MCNTMKYALHPKYASLFYRTTFSLRKYFIVQFILVQQTNSFLYRRFICEAHVKREMIFCQNEDKFGLIVGEPKWPSQVLFRQREILGKGEMKKVGRVSWSWYSLVSFVNYFVEKSELNKFMKAKFLVASKSRSSSTLLCFHFLRTKRNYKLHQRSVPQALLNFITRSP